MKKMLLTKHCRESAEAGEVLSVGEVNDFLKERKRGGGRRAGERTMGLRSRCGAERHSRNETSSFTKNNFFL